MIKLKSLIREQAPMAPPMGGAPVPMQAPPAAAAPSPEDQQPVAPEPDTDVTPSPEDPGEYDWTKDFRAFEDAKNKAEAQAKKKLLDKMNKSIVGKKVTANASRGYGQPKTDHTIDNVKKVSVEFWYKEWVVILQDENDKKYFLTPGVNIKIEQGAGGEAGGSDDQAPTEPDAAQTGTTGEEQPNPEQPAAPGGADMGMGGAPDMGMGGTVPPVPGATGAAPAPGAEVPGAVPQATPATPQQPTPQDMGVPQMDIPKKKKKIQEKIVKHWNVGKDISFFLMEFMAHEFENVDFASYVKTSKCVINESKTAEAYKVRLEIPVHHLKKSVDVRDIKLAAKEKLFSSGNVDQRFIRGSVDISKVGRLYVMDFVKQTEWKS